MTKNLKTEAKNIWIDLLRSEFGFDENDAIICNFEEQGISICLEYGFLTVVCKDIKTKTIFLSSLNVNYIKHVEVHEGFKTTIHYVSFDQNALPCRIYPECAKNKIAFYDQNKDMNVTTMTIIEFRIQILKRVLEAIHQLEITKNQSLKFSRISIPKFNLN